MPEQEGEMLRAEDAVLGGEIGVADAGCHDSYQSLTWTRRVDGELFNLTWFARLPRDHALGCDRVRRRA